MIRRKGFTTITKLSEADVNSISDEEIETLNLVGFKTVEQKRERINVFITEAQYIVSKAK